MDTSKIIKGAVSNGRYTVTAPIVKEDYGLQLQIEGVELPPTYQVDFSNSEQNGTSVTMIGNSDGVLIPHQFIDTGKDIFAFLYHVGEDYGRTVYKFRIPNKVRPDRTEDTPTPEEQNVIDQAISVLNEAVEQTAQDVISADASAQSAQGYAEQAESARDTAQTYANNASASATSASQSATASANSATASAQSASQSAQIKADVEDLVDDAQAAANASERSASNAYTYATSAERSSVNASASAQSASGYASQAQTYSQTASAKAQDASGYAQTASQKATESAQSASQALSYKTDAESAKTASQTAQGLAEQARDTAVSAKTDAESAKADAESARDEAQQAVTSISDALDDKAPVITDTASGSIASFTDGADDLPLKSLVVNIDPVQDLHGQENPYPAGGGKNKLPNTYTTTTINGVTFTVNSDGTILVNGTATANAFFTLYNADFLRDSPSGSYILNGCPSGSRSSTYNMDVQGASGSDQGSGVFINYTASNFNTSVRIRIYSGYTASNLLFKPMIRLSTVTDATYAPYENICPISGWTEVNVNHSDADMTNPTTITIQLGQTVYGGKLDVLSGVLVIDRAMVDLGTLTGWKKSTLAKGSVFRTIINGKKAGVSPLLCSQYAYQANGGFGGADMTVTDTESASYSQTIFVTDTRYNDYTTLQFSTAMSGVQLVYELATPIEMQLSDNQVNSLLGVNNLWADSGDTTAEYRADTKLFIERLTAPDSADMIADANITSGQYFMVGNSLYKATANIANGSAIVVGTNCTRKSLSEALNEINA